jgi:hypothetical protein
MNMETAAPKSPRKTVAGAAAKRKASTKPAARKPKLQKRMKTESAKVRKPGAKLVDKLSLDKVAESAKDVAHAQLGLYGKVYDELNLRISQAREDAPRQWNSLIKRGEQVRRDLDKARRDLRKDLKARVESLDVSADISQRIDQVRSKVEKLRKRVLNAA